MSARLAGIETRDLDAAIGHCRPALEILRGARLFVFLALMIGIGRHHDRPLRPFRIGIKALDLAEQLGRLVLVALGQRRLGSLEDLFRALLLQRHGAVVALAAGRHQHERRQKRDTNRLSESRYHQTRILTHDPTAAS